MTLRSRLSTDTRNSHEAVERAFEHFDLSTDAGMAATLAAHANSLARLIPALFDSPEIRDEIARLASLAKSSLEAVAEKRPQHLTNESADFDPRSVAYVVFGSRLGASVMTRRLDRLGKEWDPQVRAYFSDRATIAHWHRLCRELDECSLTEEEAERVVDDACKVFGVFEQEVAAQRAFMESEFE
ncbi:biliverdin-producing heme oxygenase [Parerythrobacter aurantius]|uniref:biliverdin-producing heme oxygenase n=1 Tax=Parerythrobacter aurantius TaxID=3127706 RepID=UPI0032488251